MELSRVMMEQKTSKRDYDSSRRQAQAEETRRRILDVARQKFMERGYTGTTVEAIAAEADVSVQTIYAIFKNKKKLLASLMNVSPLTGVEDRTPMPERANIQAVSRERDRRRQLQRFAEIVASNLDQVAGIFEVMTDAARVEPDFERMVEKLNKQRLEHMTLAVRDFASNGPFRTGMDQAYARDIVWALTSGEVFLLLTRERGWSKEKYADWLTDMLVRALLPG
jgi:AcrR family transcriptional regulator